MKYPVRKTKCGRIRLHMIPSDIKRVFGKDLIIQEYIGSSRETFPADDNPIQMINGKEMVCVLMRKTTHKHEWKHIFWFVPVDRIIGL